MSRYDVYGLGNALVDVEYQVTEIQLQALGVEKGVMTLVEQAQQQHIITQLTGKELKKGSGGSAANSIIAVSQFGGSAYYSCRVANDALGHFYVKDLQDAGVVTNIDSAKQNEGVTGTCLVFVTPDADRTMYTFLGASAEFSIAQLAPAAIRDAQYLYIEGYLVTGDSTRNAAIEARSIARAAQVKTAFSLSDPNMVKFFKAGLLDMMGGPVDLLFANEAEALGMADSVDINQAIVHLKTLAKQFVITRGKEGAVIYDGQQLLAIAPHTVKAVDTVGAGDMFAGAYLYGVTQGMSVQQAGDLAVRASAQLVTHFGPRMPSSEVQKILQAFNTH
ncbi:MAG: adenosine kinase [Gammaproteobacteria bacterium]|nr:adenosine kinase [Gammaproteobacteria bacterium]